jgi:hypothetical protein
LLRSNLKGSDLVGRNLVGVIGRHLRGEMEAGRQVVWGQATTEGVSAFERMQKFLLTLTFIVPFGSMALEFIDELIFIMQHVDVSLIVELC